MLRPVRLRRGSSVGSEVEGGEAGGAARDGGVRDHPEGRHHGSHLPGSSEHGK